MSVLPDIESLKTHLNKHIQASFGDDYVIDYDMMAIAEMQDDLEKVSTMLRQMDWITDNEKRTATQYDRYEHPSADKLYKPAGLMPIDEDFDSGFGAIDENLNSARG